MNNGCPAFVAPLFVAVAFALSSVGCGPTVETSSSSEYCYEFSCNSRETGEQCFESKEAYCDAICSESTCRSQAEATCEADCDQSYTG